MIKDKLKGWDIITEGRAIIATKGSQQELIATIGALGSVFMEHKQKMELTEEVAELIREVQK